MSDTEYVKATADRLEDEKLSEALTLIAEIHARNGLDKVNPILREHASCDVEEAPAELT
jgi:hypothetical protein